MTSETHFLEKAVAGPRTSLKERPLHRVIGEKLRQRLENLEGLIPPEDVKNLEGASKSRQEALTAFQNEDYRTVIADLKGMASYFEAGLEEHKAYARSLLALVDEINEFCPQG